MKRKLLSLLALLCFVGVSTINAQVRDRIAIPDGSPNGSELTKEVLETDAEGNTLSAKYTITNGTWGNNASHLSIFKFAPLSKEVIGTYEKIVVEFGETIPTSTGDATYGFIPVGLASPVNWTKLGGKDKWEYTFKDADRKDGIEDFSIFFNANGDLKNIEFTITGIYLEGYVEPAPEPWVCPEGEIDFTTLPVVGTLQANNIGNTIDGGTVVYGNQSNGSDYTDVTAYESVKFYGTPGLSLRIFVNREGDSGVTVGKTEQQVTLNSDGVAELYVLAAMAATEKEYCYISSVKTNWGAGGKIDGITVTEKSAPYTISTAVGKVGTIVLDYSASIKGATLYEVVGFSETEGLFLDEVKGMMVGGTPYIYQATADEVACYKAGASVEHGDFDCTKGEVGNGLVGCYSKVSPSTWWAGFIKSSYIISGGLLYKIGEGKVTIPANRCFFDSSKCKNNNQANAKMQLGFGEDATAIQNVNEALDGGKIYDLNGREVKTMKKGGIYIMGGMKVSIK